MNELLETKIRRKLSVLEDFARQTQPQGPDFFGQFKQGVLDALASHKTSTLKKLDRELDTMAEEVFALPSAKPFREQYWSGEPSVIEEEVKRALRERRIRDEDQARAILIYLDQVGQNLRENFLQDNDTQVLSALMGDFEARSENR